MKVPDAVLDLALSTPASYVAIKAMEPVSMRLYELERKAARDREDAVRPGPPYRVAAEKLTRLAGLELTEKRLQRVSLPLHYGLAVQCAPLYPLLRRRASLGPVTAA